jgi:hypothetical protein
MEDKIKRFIELSKEFTVKSNDVYGDFNHNAVFTFTGSGGSYYWTGAQAQNIQPPTKLEQFTKEQQDKVEKAKRFEEYITLQRDLSDYYNALIKLK